MSATDRAAEEVLTTGRLPGGDFEVRVPKPVAFWRGDRVGFSFCVRRERGGAFNGLITGCQRERDGSWQAIETVAALGVSDGPPVRPRSDELGAAGLELFGTQGMASHMAFPGLAAAGLDEVSLTVGAQTTRFPVFEPFGFFLMVVPDQPPGTAIQLTGHPDADPVVHTVWEPWFLDPEDGLVAFDLIDKVAARPLTAHIVERLRPLLPDGWNLTAQPSAAVLHGEGEMWSVVEVTWIFEQQAGADAVVLAAEQILSQVQDVMAEYTTDPWPSERGSLPIPYARIAGEELLCGYGAADRPFLELEPIRLAELLESGHPR
jgi:hypothetical protein